MTCDTYVELLPLRSKIIRLYADVTGVVQQLLPDVDLHLFEFPSIRRVQVPSVVWDRSRYQDPLVPECAAQVPARSHSDYPGITKVPPTSQFFGDVPEHKALDHPEFVFDCRRFMLPVVHDVMVRLLFRGLPTRSKFWLLQGGQPDIIFSVAVSRRCGPSYYDCGDGLVGAPSAGEKCCWGSRLTICDATKPTV